MTLPLILLFLSYVACGVLDYGFFYAHLTHICYGLDDVSEKKARKYCSVFALLGPISLLAGFFAGQCKHGLLYRRLTDYEIAKLIEEQNKV